MARGVLVQIIRFVGAKAASHYKQQNLQRLHLQYNSDKC